MKFKILLMAMVASLGLVACQSEYGERMSKAMELKRKYQEVQGNFGDSRNPLLEVQLSNIEKEIKFQATLSGNESMFLKEIWNN